MRRFTRATNWVDHSRSDSVLMVETSLPADMLPRFPSLTHALPICLLCSSAAEVKKPVAAPAKPAGGLFGFGAPKKAPEPPKPAAPAGKTPSPSPDRTLSGSPLFSTC